MLFRISNSSEKMKKRVLDSQIILSSVIALNKNAAIYVIDEDSLETIKILFKNVREIDVIEGDLGKIYIN